MTGYILEVRRVVSVELLFCSCPYRPLSPIVGVGLNRIDGLIIIGGVSLDSHEKPFVSISCVYRNVKHG